MALQFEWAWQHCDKSLIVRAAIGDETARKVKRKRGLRGQLEILKTILHQCPDLFSRQKLALYFFDKSLFSIYEKLDPERTDGAPKVSLHQVGAVEDMPFFKCRALRARPKGDIHDDGLEEHTAENVSGHRLDCVWCRRAISQLDRDTCFRCDVCDSALHDVCADLYFSRTEAFCPTCGVTVNPCLSDDDQDLCRDLTNDAMTRGTDDSFDSDSAFSDAQSKKVTRCVRSRMADAGSRTDLEDDSSDGEFPPFGSPSSSPNRSMIVQQMLSAKAALPIIQSSGRSSPDVGFTSPIDLIKFRSMSLSSPADSFSRPSIMLPQTKADSVSLRPENEQDRSVIWIHDSDTDSSMSCTFLNTKAPSVLLTRPRILEAIDICSP